MHRHGDDQQHPSASVGGTNCVHLVRHLPMDPEIYTAHICRRRVNRQLNNQRQQGRRRLDRTNNLELVAVDNQHLFHQ